MSPIYKTSPYLQKFICLRRFKYLLPRAHPNKQFNSYMEVLLVVILLLHRQNCLALWKRTEKSEDWARKMPVPCSQDA